MNDFVEGLVIGAVATAFVFWSLKADSAELRVQHTSKASHKGVKENVQQVKDCLDAIRRIRAQSATAQRYRFWCDGRRV